MCRPLVAVDAVCRPLVTAHGVCLLRNWRACFSADQKASIGNVCKGIVMSKSTRRTFLATAAATTAALGRGVHAAAENRYLKMGVLGVGWYGRVDAKAAL